MNGTTTIICSWRLQGIIGLSWKRIRRPEATLKARHLQKQTHYVLRKSRYWTNYENMVLIPIFDLQLCNSSVKW
jgi:hypothetical protein